jgi:hypothetical protein
MSEFRQYRRYAIAELRPVTQHDIDEGLQNFDMSGISISTVDIDNGSPKIGDMIARNPVNHDDQWLVAADYFKANFEELK